MSQNRDAPAYQEYAAALLSKIPFRKMSLQERGLLFTMRLECWVNLRLPANHADLAKVLGVASVEIETSLAAVMPFFEALDGHIVSPELENYRAHLAERRVKQSQGGKIGSAMTNKRRNSQAESESAGVLSGPRVARRVTRVSLVQASAKQQSQNQSSEKAVDPFISDYEDIEKVSADDYVKASRGR